VQLSEGYPELSTATHLPQNSNRGLLSNNGTAAKIKQTTEKMQRNEQKRSKRTKKAMLDFLSFLQHVEESK